MDIVAAALMVIVSFVFLGIVIDATRDPKDRDWSRPLCGTRTDGDVNYKRKRPKQRRAGCLLCKPNKLGKGMERELGHRGFGKLRKEAAAKQDLSDAGSPLSRG